MAITDNYWFEISDLTVFQAAYWMQIGDDPRLHELRYENESVYADYYDGHPGGCEAVSAKCEVILSAVRNEKISLPPAEDSSRDTDYSYETLINKESWIKWCHEIGSLNNIDKLHIELLEKEIARLNSIHGKDATKEIANEAMLAKLQGYLAKWRTLFSSLQIGAFTTPLAQLQTKTIQPGAHWTVDPRDDCTKGFQPWYTAARYFARELVKEDSKLLKNRHLLCSKIVQCFDKEGIKKRGDKKPFEVDTIKKALSNIILT